MISMVRVQWRLTTDQTAAVYRRSNNEARDGGLLRNVSKLPSKLKTAL